MIVNWKSLRQLQHQSDCNILSDHLEDALRLLLIHRHKGGLSLRLKATPVTMRLSIRHDHLLINLPLHTSFT